MTKKMQDIMLRVCRSAAPHQTSYHGVFPSNDMWAVCDGYRFIKTKEKPSGIDLMEPPPNGWIDLDSAINKAWDAEMISPPTEDEVKQRIQESGSTRRRPVIIEPFSGWTCNPHFLLDMIQAMPRATYFKPKSQTSPLYCIGESGDALLLPRR